MLKTGHELFPLYHCAWAIKAAASKLLVAVDRRPFVERVISSVYSKFGAQILASRAGFVTAVSCRRHAEVEEEEATGGSGPRRREPRTEPEATCSSTGLAAANRKRVGRAVRPRGRRGQSRPYKAD